MEIVLPFNWDTKNQVYVIEVYLRLIIPVIVETVAGSTAIHANVSDLDPLLQQPLPDNLDQAGWGYTQHWEVVSRLDFYGFGKYSAQLFDLVER